MAVYQIFSPAGDSEAEARFPGTAAEWIKILSTSTQTPCLTEINQLKQHRAILGRAVRGCSVTSVTGLIQNVHHQSASPFVRPLETLVRHYLQE